MVSQPEGSLNLEVKGSKQWQLLENRGCLHSPRLRIKQQVRHSEFVKFRSLASAPKHPPAGLKRLRRLMEFGFIRVLLPTQVKITLSPKHCSRDPRIESKSSRTQHIFQFSPNKYGGPTYGE